MKKFIDKIFTKAAEITPEPDFGTGLIVEPDQDFVPNPVITPIEVVEVVEVVEEGQTLNEYISSEFEKKREYYTNKNNYNARLMSVMEEHQFDYNTYKFQCQRFGDFLTVIVDRVKNSKPVVIDREQSSINISNCRLIKLVKGKIFNNDGKATIYSQINARTCNLNGRRLYWGQDCSIRVEEEHQPYRTLINTVNENNNNLIGNAFHHQNGIWMYSSSTQDWPNYAIDDVIIFEGTNVHISVPCSKGEIIYREILDEMDRWSSHKNLPKI